MKSLRFETTHYYLHTKNCEMKYNYKDVPSSLFRETPKLTQTNLGKVNQS